MVQSGPLLASGGADDRIIVYDLKSRKELYTLDHHSGTINCLRFTQNNSHLISGGADGALAIVRIGSWLLEKIWDKAHKGAPILDIALHSSGKLALTLGGDCTLQTWNLIKGRKAFAVNLNSKSSDAKSLQLIQWAPNGVNFVLAGGKYTEVWSIETGGIDTSIQHEEKVVCCIWATDSTLITGYENGKIATVDVKTGDIKMIDGHSSRVKTISKFKEHFVTSCSSGEVKIWNKKLVEILKFDTGCRVTCAAILPLQTVKTETEITAKGPATKRTSEESTQGKGKRKKKKKSSTNDWNIEKVNV